jgi:hypothetical protein
MPATPIGLSLRVTRPMRYSLYRAGDATGSSANENGTTRSRASTPFGPWVGPFLDAGAAGLLFHYADSGGTRLPSPVVDPGAVALMDVEMRAETKSAVRVLGSAASAGEAYRLEASHDRPARRR